MDVKIGLQGYVFEKAYDIPPSLVVNVDQIGKMIFQLSNISNIVGNFDYTI